MKHKRKIVLIGDSFPPLRNSCSIQLRDLSQEFALKGHDITVIIPTSDLDGYYSDEILNGVRVLRLKAPRIRGINFFKRTINECLMPFYMYKNLRKSGLSKIKWEGIIWYSPSIFHGIFIKYLKKTSGCKGYLIIRDIFPQWALDIGLIRRGIPYHFFNIVAKYQYKVADTIGVQSKGNLDYFVDWAKKPHKNVEVLNNWLNKPHKNNCSIQLKNTILADKKVFVYAGNMGVAQGLDTIVDMIANLKNQSDIGFLFLGRGSHLRALEDKAKKLNIDNILFLDEINPNEIFNLYKQCIAGIVSLDSRHKSHNIPGKFLSYIQSGLPILANINPGNDLAELIKKHDVGVVCENNEVTELLELVKILLNKIETEQDLELRCKKLFSQKFDVKKIVPQIMKSLFR
jgi:glycosyltransferase involved in cell wall biosynthesis